MQKDNDKFYGVFRSKKYWRQALDDPEGGEWVVNNCPPDNDCYSGQLVREYLSDMSFVAMDKFGREWMRIQKILKIFMIFDRLI